MLRDHERIAREMGDPALVRLHRKLGRLSSILTAMNTGAHPDDEASGMLAALRFGLGMRIIIACSTRGEGGQNALGTERGAALGAVRTLEMAAAARVLDADVAWLGHGPDDPVHDFGFSKDGDDTLARWGEERIVERLVRAYRVDRPDIVIATFLDVPGQHGHHRAMKRAAEIAIGRAADPDAYAHHLGVGLKPWRVAKFYLPAWSGGGSTYDDEVPPPTATLTVNAGTVDPATGAPFARIGEWSRAAHRTQGMGVWLEKPPQTWPLHLRLGLAPGLGTEADIREGLRANIGALASIDGMSAAASTQLIAAQRAIEAAQAAFPHREAIVDAALNASDAVNDALDIMPDDVRDFVDHRLQRKLRELDAVILEARGVRARGWAQPAAVAPGGKTIVHVMLDTPDDKGWAKPVVGPMTTLASRESPDGIRRFELKIPSDADVTGPYPPYHRTLGGNGTVALAFGTEIGGRMVRAMADLEEPFRIVPTHQLACKPTNVIISLSERPSTVEITPHITGGEIPGSPTFALPPGWQTKSAGDRILVIPPTDLQPGHYVLDAMMNGEPAYRATAIAYPHIEQSTYFSRERLNVLALDLTLPERARIGYVAGGSDRVGDWLEAMGLDVTDLDSSTLQGDLTHFSTIVVGTLAFASRPKLAGEAAQLRRYVETGGHLVTLYQRPGEGWLPSSTPPRRIEIGSPSLRWRVTNPEAVVTILAPSHPLLAGPNSIDTEDWAGWHKERGIYFASSWDDAYIPLVAIMDAGEKPLTGGLLSAAIGSGRHTHVSLVLHHQLDRLVPGAFRLLANLVQPTPAYLKGK